MFSDNLFFSSTILRLIFYYIHLFSVWIRMCVHCVSVRTCMSIYIHVYVCSCMCVSVCVHIHACMCACAYVHVYAPVWVCMYSFQEIVLSIPCGSQEWTKLIVLMKSSFFHWINCCSDVVLLVYNFLFRNGSIIFYLSDYTLIVVLFVVSVFW